MLSVPRGGARYPEDQQDLPSTKYADLAALRLWIAGGRLHVSFELNALFTTGQTFAALAIDTDDNPATGGGVWGSLLAAAAHERRRHPAHVERMGSAARLRAGRPGHDRDRHGDEPDRGQGLAAARDQLARSGGHRDHRGTQRLQRRLPQRRERVVARGEPGDGVVGGGWRRHLRVRRDRLRRGSARRRHAARESGPGFYSACTYRTTRSRRTPRPVRSCTTRVPRATRTARAARAPPAFPVAAPPRERSDSSSPRSGATSPTGSTCPRAPRRTVSSSTCTASPPRTLRRSSSPACSSASERISTGSSCRRSAAGRTVGIRTSPSATCSTHSPTRRRTTRSIPSACSSSGYSMGGYGTYYFAALYPQLFAGFVDWVGYPGDGCERTPLHNTCPNGGPANAYEFFENLEHIPGAMLYGGEDELVNYQQGEAVRARFSELALPHVFYFHPAPNTSPSWPPTTGRRRRRGAPGGPARQTRARALSRRALGRRACARDPARPRLLGARHHRSRRRRGRVFRRRANGVRLRRERGRDGGGVSRVDRRRPGAVDLSGGQRHRTDRAPGAEPDRGSIC